MNKLIGAFIEIILDRFMNDYFERKRIIAVFFLSGFILVLPILFMCRFKDSSLEILFLCFSIQSFFLLMYIYHMQKNWSRIDDFAKTYIDGIVREQSADYLKIKKRLNSGKYLLPINWIIISITIGMFSNIFPEIPFINNIGVNVNYIYMFCWFSAFVFVAMILMPNYIFYASAQLELQKRMSEHDYFVEVYENDNLTASFSIKCSEISGGK